MELRHMKYFVTVVDEGSFTRAAERLSVAQSPVSHQVRKLERELGVTLLERTTRSIALTEAGRVFYNRCVSLLAAAEDAVESARKADRGEIGSLSLGFIGSATYELMPNLVRAYRERSPYVELTLRSEMLSPAQVDALLDGTLSVGLLRPPVKAPEIVVELLRNEPLMAVVPVQHRLATYTAIDLDDLAGENFIGYRAPSTMYDTLINTCAQAGFMPIIRQHVGETATLVAMVAAGLGVSLAPESIRHLRMNGVTYRPLRSPETAVPLALAYHKDAVGPLTRRYLDIARTVLRSKKLINVTQVGQETGAYVDSI
ncbi:MULTISPECIES: LysR family transcriptional regulator [unclassified Rhodococcus (in: high G+C Gram-positive bacteria)]|uniref:LysR family transcriptional regulator n=1 Tax=unclassified Rhodococcus (in: high G+C Gram-positive bacteria) TaxID=192944 RepID=UPI0011433F67|nr:MULTISPECIES: LysR family transcriptional regulator [unclassified Rhodococcus (in: high G+C Gram-positive bacteria)]RZL20869.1 MAG: LysR family transcriptional regulator [Rhodococcus sp. (in: high G+C Gram-positive bacteria)]